jgi:hypothetical protein
MHFTQLHARKRAADPRGGRSTRIEPAPSRHGHSVGQQLRAALGDRYSIAWLAGRLQCSLESAEALDGYWIVSNAHGRTQMLAVFARTLEIEQQRLLALFAEVDRSAPAPVPRKAASQPQAAVSAAPQHKQHLTIGSNEGIREIRRTQPKIEWRRARVPAPSAD